MSYADALARRNGALQLPAPSANGCGGAYWRLSTGELVHAALEAVHVGRELRSLDALEADALAVLAAVAWARGRSEGGAG